MKLYDISQTLRSGLPVWPGDTAFAREETWSMADGSPVAVSKMTLSTHSGTHGDAPSHYDAEGQSSELLDIAPYLGQALVIDVSAMAVNLLEVSHIEPLLPQTGALERVLIRLYAAFPHDHWDSDFPGVAPETIHWLANRGCTLIGVDTPSLDPETSKTMAAHKAVEANDMRILEGLVLDDVPPGTYELIALPLKIEGADASPLRAVLREIRDD